MFIPLVLCDQLEGVVEDCDQIIYFFSYFAVYCFSFILYVAAYMANKVVYITQTVSESVQRFLQGLQDRPINRQTDRPTVLRCGLETNETVRTEPRL